MPAIIYGAHVSTTLVPILYHILTALTHLTLTERLCLSAVYTPYLVIPLILVYYMLTSVHYQPTGFTTGTSRFTSLTDQMSVRLKHH